MRILNVQPVPVTTTSSKKETIERKISYPGKESPEAKKEITKELASRVQEQMEDFTDDVALESSEVADILKKGLLLKLHKDTDRYFVQVINVETQEVLQELPPEEFLDLVAKIRNLVGVFLDESV